MQGLLEHHPSVDDIVVLPRSRWRELWHRRHFLQLLKEFRQFVKALKQRQFTLAIDAQGLLKSAIFAWLSGAKRRVGLNSKEGSARLHTETFYAPYSKHIGNEYRYLLKQLGVTGQTKMSVGTVQQDHDFVNQLIKNEQVIRQYVVFCPFSTRVQKNWSIEHWQQLAKQLEQQWQVDCLILGAPDDTVEAQQIADSQNNLFDLTGKTSLRQAAAAIKNAKAVVGVDTGLTHMGMVSEVPTIALFGSTCPYLHTDSNVAKVIYHDLDCAPCKRRPSCEGSFDCMVGITPAEVMQELQAVIN
jgi:heptosyltransferase-1